MSSDPRRVIKGRESRRVREWVNGVSAALMQLDPAEFVGDRARWLALMNGARAVGVPLEVFCEWTADQDYYERDDDEVERDWWSLRAEHPGAFYAELAAAGIRMHGSGGADYSPRVRSVTQPTSKPQRTLNFYARIEQARAPLQHARGSGREPALYTAACILAEMVGERRMAMSTAADLLRSDCQTNGLWREDRAVVERTIGRAFRHVEEKFL
jgi:hypothetical protein